MPFYLNPKQDDFNQIPELQVCLAEALYDAEAVLSNPSAFKAERNQDPAGSDHIQPRAGVGDDGER